MGFLIPALATFIGFALIGVWPFGNGTVLIVDSIHQYLPFYTDLHEKLVNHESLLYSFSAGLGYDFWATFAYYMASPLNFLLALLPKANVADAMDLFIILKIGLCGGTFSWYLHKREPGRKFLNVWAVPVLRLVVQLLYWVYALHLLLSVFCGLPSIKEKDPTARHPEIRSAVWLVFSAGRRHGQRGAAAGLYGADLFRIYEEQQLSICHKILYELY